MVQRTNTKCCGVSILFVVLVTYFVIPELDCKRLLRAGETRKHDDKKARSFQTHSKHKPKIEYNENTSKKSKAPKSEKRHDKYDIDEGDDRGTDLTRPEKKDKYTGESAKSKSSESKPDNNHRQFDESAEVEGSSAEQTKSRKSNSKSSEKLPHRNKNEDANSRTDLTRSEKKYKYTGQSAKSKSSKSKADKNDRNVDESIEVEESSAEQTKSSKSESKQSEKSSERSGFGRSFLSNEKEGSSQQNPSKQHNHRSARRSKNNSRLRSNESKSKTLKSVIHEKHYKSNNHAYDKHKDSKGSTNTELDNVTPGIAVNKEVEADFGTTVTEEPLISDSSTSFSYASRTTTPYIEPTTFETSILSTDTPTNTQMYNTELIPKSVSSTDTPINTPMHTTESNRESVSSTDTTTNTQMHTTELNLESVSSTDTTTKTPMHNIELNPKSVSSSGTSTKYPMYTTELNRKSVSSTDTTTNTPMYTTELNRESGQDSENDALNVLNMEPGIIIKPPFHGRKRCKERTPPCCINGQLEINLGTINRKARATGVLEGVNARVSDKPYKWFIRCSFSAEIKVSFETMGNEGCFGCTKGPFCGRRLLQLDLDLSRNKRRNTLFDISDSSHKSDGATVHADFPNITIYPRHSAENRTRHIRIQRALNAHTGKITIFIGNQFMRLINDNRLDENFCDNDLFHLNGQFDPESGGISPNEITIGINRAITRQEDEASFGICSAVLRWACPWQENN